jgi:hypothetical protein
MIGLYLHQILSYFIHSYHINKPSIGLLCIYIKYLLDIITNNNMSLLEYEMSRTIMWVFTTPLMLRMYCEANNLTLWDINVLFHVVSISPMILLLPFKSHRYYHYIVFLLYIPGGFFMKSLYKYKHLPFTHMYLYFWFIFMAGPISSLWLSMHWNTRFIRQASCYIPRGLHCAIVCSRSLYTSSECT